MIADNIIYLFLTFRYLPGPELGIENGFFWEITWARKNDWKCYASFDLTDSLFVVLSVKNLKIYGW